MFVEHKTNIVQKEYNKKGGNSIDITPDDRLKQATISVRINQADYALLVAYCEQEQITISKLVRKIIADTTKNMTTIRQPNILKGYIENKIQINSPQNSPQNT